MTKIFFKDKETINSLCSQLLTLPKKSKEKHEYATRLHEINQWCLANISVRGEKYSFKRIITADFDEIVEIAHASDLVKTKLSNDHKQFIINTLYAKKFPRLAFVEKLNVAVCPYCNRNFINSAKKRTSCDLDHFFEKTKYPILAVSFYNLVPVCHVCNHIKGTKRLKFSPHDSKYDTDDLLSFDYHITGLDYLWDKEKIEIEIDAQDNYNDDIKILKLRELYQLHSDIVQECIKKATIFNSSYLDNLVASYSELFESKEELYRIIYGNYFEENSYGNRPLSKFTNDILKQSMGPPENSNPFSFMSKIF